MVKVKKESVLIRPCDVKPSSPEFEVLGTFNPGAIRLANGDIVLYVRVAERMKAKAVEDVNYSMLQDVMVTKLVK